MSIIFHPETQVFHLFNQHMSYIMDVLPNGQLSQIYYGARLRDRADFAHLQDGTCRPISSNPIGALPNFSLEFTRQAYPGFGTTDFRNPAFALRHADGSHVSDFRYVSHTISAGKPHLEGLPQAYVEAGDEADTLEVTLRDEHAAVELVLLFTLYRERDVLTRSARFVNCGAEAVELERALSVCVDFPDHDLVWTQFSGAWARERTPVERPLDIGVTAIESMRGHSSAHQNPFVLLRRPNTTEDSGECFGFSLVYSGNFLAQAEVDTYDVTRFTMGINPRQFRWHLTPGEAFQTPEVLLTWSDAGMNGLSQTLHHLLRERVARGPWRDRPRPVLLNNWEATGMTFTEADVLRIAQKGAEVGVELFVLDDGWFGKRTEFSGLGDWFADRSKLPGGVKGLADKINDLGLEFGIWIEPEMVNEDSELYRAHPEYVLCTPGRGKSLGRNQLVLDFSNPEVVDYVFGMLVRAFEGAKLSYIKWDMNRSITECYSSHWPAERQGEVYHRYILGVYRLYEKLLAQYPGLLIESCASGGSRFDAGMLYYAPQAWCSDDTDAAERVKIQYGSSYGYPVSSWGAHVSECPNQQLGRTTPLKTRANVAYFGAFGYEMDLNQLSDAEIEEVKAQVAFMKEHRALIQFGSFYRLRSPFGADKAAWMVVSPDKKEAIVGVYQMMNRVNNGFTQIPLRGLDPALDYRVDGHTVFGGDELMRFGLMPLDSSAHPMAGLAPMAREPELRCDYDSHLYLLRAVE